MAEIVKTEQSDQEAWDRFARVGQYERLSAALGKLDRRKRNFSDIVHVRTQGGSLCVGSSEGQDGVRKDRTATMYVMRTDDEITVGLNELRDEKGRLFQAGLVRFGEDGAVQRVPDQSYDGYVLHLTPTGEASLSGIAGQNEVPLDSMEHKDTDTFLFGCLQALEKRSQT
jgi:hypothetical protein